MANAVLTGTETLQVLAISSNGSPAATTQTTTTAAIAGLANLVGGQEIIETSITTVGAGTLTAAALVGGQIARTGPVAAYTDTTDTAVAIVAALPGFTVNQTFLIRIKNATAFTQTLAAGAGVTLPATVIIPAFSFGWYFATVTSTTAVTLTHMGTEIITVGTSISLPAISSLATVGAGTILAASMVGGIVSRSGAQSATAFTDTTDTAANIIAANASLVNKIGAAMIVKYQNTTNAPATITGGTGVTVSVITVVPANSTASYMLTYTAAATLTMVGFELALAPTTSTFTSNGATPVTVANTAVSPNSIITTTLKTVGGTVGATQTIKTITPGTGFTIVGLASDTSVYNYSIVG